jgi:serine/threonine protein kinase
VFDVLGISLFDFMEKNSFRPFPVEEVRHFAVQLSVAIEYMHSKRLTHTNLKPENIMVDSAQTLKVCVKKFDLLSKKFPNTDTSPPHQPLSRMRWFCNAVKCDQLELTSQCDQSKSPFQHRTISISSRALRLIFDILCRCVVLG